MTTAKSGAGRGRAGIAVRLAAEDWNAMTAAANASANHVSGMDRWERLARESDPSADDEQILRLAESLRAGHYREMGRKSGASRRATREAEGGNRGGPRRPADSAAPLAS